LQTAFASFLKFDVALFAYFSFFLKLQAITVAVFFT
jgi:hypothetical protein